MATFIGKRSHLLLALLILGGCGGSAPDLPPPATTESATATTIQVDTPRYSISSTTNAAATQQGQLALDAVFAAYTEFFPMQPAGHDTGGLRVRLYRDRAEFQASNRSLPWAEAYYVDGVCHAYIDPTKANPYHWLIHEAVHQLNREVTGFAKERWINEGLATYFGSSRYRDGRLALGVPDPEAYPLWWLDRWALTGDWSTDVQRRQVIPLRTLVTGQGQPSLGAAVNAYYLGWWSLTHFLLHHDNGRYAAGYRRLIKQGGSLAEFEQAIGPVEQVEAEWYAYFQQLVAQAKDNEAPIVPAL